MHICLSSVSFPNLKSFSASQQNLCTRNCWFSQNAPRPPNLTPATSCSFQVWASLQQADFDKPTLTGFKGANMIQAACAPLNCLQLWHPMENVHFYGVPSTNPQGWYWHLPSPWISCIETVNLWRSAGTPATFWWKFPASSMSQLADNLVARNTCGGVV